MRGKKLKPVRGGAIAAGYRWGKAAERGANGGTI